MVTTICQLVIQPVGLAIDFSTGARRVLEGYIASRKAYSLCSYISISNYEGTYVYVLSIVSKGVSGTHVMGWLKQSCSGLAS